MPPARAAANELVAPLAVAATLGALAVGLMQLVTPERTGAPGRDGGVVPDMPATTAARQAEGAKKQAAGASNEVAPPEEKARAMSAPAASAGGGDRTEAQAQSAAPTAQPAPFHGFKQQRTRKDAAHERKRDAGPVAAPATPRGTRHTRRTRRTTPRLRHRRQSTSRNPRARPLRASRPCAPRRPLPPRQVPLRRTPASHCIRPRRPNPRAPLSAFARGERDATGSDDQARSGERRGARRAPARQRHCAARTQTAERQDACAQAAAENRAAPLEKLKPRQPKRWRPWRRDERIATRCVANRTRRRRRKANPRCRRTAPAGTPTRAWPGIRRRPCPLDHADSAAVAEKSYGSRRTGARGFRTAHPDAQRLLPPDLRDWKAPR